MTSNESLFCDWIAILFKTFASLRIISKAKHWVLCYSFHLYNKVLYEDWVWNSSLVKSFEQNHRRIQNCTSTTQIYTGALRKLCCIRKLYDPSMILVNKFDINSFILRPLIKIFLINGDWDKFHCFFSCLFWAEGPNGGPSSPLKKNKFVVTLSVSGRGASAPLDEGLRPHQKE